MFGIGGEYLRIPLCKPDIGFDEINYVTQVLRSGTLGHGAQVQAFESEFANFIGSKFAVSFNSWTSGAFLVMKFLKECGTRNEVILPSFSFVASANVVINAGLIPVFAEIDKDTLDITPETVRPLINAQTVAIMPVHFAGKPAGMMGLQSLANEYGIALVEDSAECIGATVDGKMAGSFDIGIFSFYPTKNMTTGEGGMVTTNDYKLNSWLRKMAAHGISKEKSLSNSNTNPWNRNAEIPGHNFRMTNFQAAMGLVQLKKLREMNLRRWRIAERYHKLLADNSRIKLMPLMDTTEHSYQMFTIMVEPSVRNSVVNYLNRNGIEASVHFDPPIHLQKAYEKLDMYLPNTEYISSQIISLPISSIQTIEETEIVCHHILQAISLTGDK